MQAILERNILIIQRVGLCCRKTIEESTLTLNLIEDRLMIWKDVELNCWQSLCSRYQVEVLSSLSDYGLSFL